MVEAPTRHGSGRLAYDNTSANGGIAWFSAVLRHFTTIAMITAGFWWLGKPRAEEFINNAVNDRIEKVEQGIEQLKVQSWDQNRKLNDVRNRQDIQQDQLDVILQRLAEISEQAEINQQERNNDR